MSSDDSVSKQQVKEAREKFERTESLVRRIGYVICFGAALAISIPMIVGAIQGIQADEVWDPFTGHPVAADDPELDCIDEAIYLTRHTEFGSEWERRYRRWRERCDDDHEDLYAMLNVVRDQLREADQPGEVLDGSNVPPQH